MACHWDWERGPDAKADAANSPGERSFRRNVGVTADFEVGGVGRLHAIHGPRDFGGRRRLHDAVFIGREASTFPWGDERRERVVH